jgi:hypothetical protein
VAARETPWSVGTGAAPGVAEVILYNTMQTNWVPTMSVLAQFLPPWNNHRLALRGYRATV